MSSNELKSENETRFVTKRVKRSHKMNECLIELDNGLIGRDLIGRLSAEVMKYLLYDRQQIPFPMTNSQSLEDLREKSKEKQLSTKEEQIKVMFDHLERVFNEVVCLVSADRFHIHSVSLSLGQTLQLPKELYCLELPPKDIYGVCHSADCPRLTLRGAVTRFFKTILNDTSILFQNRKDIATTKIFVLIKVNKSDVQQVMDHSSTCERLKTADGQHFTPHVDYEIPRIGNRFKLLFTQKHCNCNNISDNNFKIFSESFGQRVEETELDLDLSEHLDRSLSVSEDAAEDGDGNVFLWIQVLSSVKGIQHNFNKNIF